MSEQPSLTQDELALMIELPERERRGLPAEIHHTRTPALRDELHQRLELVGALTGLPAGFASGFFHLIGRHGSGSRGDQPNRQLLNRQ